MEPGKKPLPRLCLPSHGHLAYLTLVSLEGGMGIGQHLPTSCPSQEPHSGQSASLLRTDRCLLSVFLFSLRHLSPWLQPKPFNTTIFIPLSI